MIQQEEELVEGVEGVCKYASTKMSVFDFFKFFDLIFQSNCMKENWWKGLERDYAVQICIHSQKFDTKSCTKCDTIR